MGILGHDLRNPLSTILTTSRVLTMLDTTPEGIKKRLERVTVSGVRIQRTIDQLLDLTRARLANGIPVTVSEHPIDLGALVARLLSNLPALISTAIPEHAPQGVPVLAQPIDVDALCGWMRRLPLAVLGRG